MAQATFLDRYRVRADVPDRLLSGDPEGLQKLLEPLLGEAIPTKDDTPGWVRIGHEPVALRELRLSRTALCLLAQHDAPPPPPIAFSSPHQGHRADSLQGQLGRRPGSASSGEGVAGPRARAGGHVVPSHFQHQSRASRAIMTVDGNSRGCPHPWPLPSHGGLCLRLAPSPLCPDACSPLFSLFSTCRPNLPPPPFCRHDSDLCAREQCGRRPITGGHDAAGPRCLG